MGDYKIDETEVSIGRFAEYAKRKAVVTEAERSGGGFEYVMGWQKFMRQELFIETSNLRIFY